MATITASMFMALDGVVDPGVGNWHFPYFNDEMGRAVDRTHDADVMLFGRVTYDSFAGGLPSAGPSPLSGSSWPPACSTSCTSSSTRPWQAQGCGFSRTVPPSSRFACSRRSHSQPE